MSDHPAPFSQAALDAIEKHLKPGWLVLDPFAGTGKIHDLQDRCGVFTVGVEIEPEWANLHPQTICGDALRLPKAWTGKFDAICTSPVFANRMSDHHEARDSSERITYRHKLGRPLHPNNAGQLQWGREYRKFHIRAYRECARVLKPEGKFIVHMSDHIRGGRIVKVVDWHMAALMKVGFYLTDSELIPARRMGYGANRHLRVETESLLIAERLCG